MLCLNVSVCVCVGSCVEINKEWRVWLIECVWMNHAITWLLRYLRAACIITRRNPFSLPDRDPHIPLPVYL